MSRRAIQLALFIGTLILSACNGTAERISLPVADERETPPVPSPGAILAEGYRDIRNDLLPLIERLTAEHELSGLSLALVDEQEIVWAEGFGYADLENKIPAGPDTVYRMGSIAKPLTATAVMQLDEIDAIDIDQPLFAYLPEFSIRSRFSRVDAPITVRSLLSHHSGLPTDLLKGMWTSQPHTRVASALAGEYTAYPPNLVFSYSNIGYALLGHLIERVSELGYSFYMREKILRPMGMQRSGFELTPELSANLARGYKNGHAQSLLPIRDVPAYGLYSTVQDLAKFIRLQFADGSVDGREILMPGSLAEMMETQNSDVPLDLGIISGLGWFVERDSVLGAGYVLRHGGTTLYYASEMILFPEHRLGVVVVSNTAGSRASVSRLAEVILARALDQPVDRRQAPTGSLLAGLPDSLQEAPSINGSGHYATELGMLVLESEQGRLCACAADRHMDLIPYPDGWFGVRRESVDSLPPSQRLLGEFRFSTRRIDGREVLVAERDGEQVLLGERLEPVPIPPVWMERLGDYEVLNPDPGFPVTDARLLVSQGSLTMTFRLPRISANRISMPLRVLSDSEAVILGLGRMRGETLRVLKNNGQEQLRYSGFLGRRITP